MTDKYRIEIDSMGEIEVPADSFWGAQTQRSLKNFAIGKDTFPPSFIQAFAFLKKAAAKTNHQLGALDAKKCELIVAACDEIIDQKHSDQFPLSVWQTGSGTQTNMNVNEVISNIACVRDGQEKGSKKPVHPNDHVNCSQSSNDTFPTAMHIACAQQVIAKLLPSLQQLEAKLAAKIAKFNHVVKIGRTHLQDAVPLTLGQSFSSYLQLIKDHTQDIHTQLDRVFELPIGGTAVGTGLNTPRHFDTVIVETISQLTQLPFVNTPNKFAGLSAHMPLAAISGAMANLSASLHKMANDIRFLGSGPRCGLGELILPSNEPGSSIMPGKVNPTQCEAMTMACLQVQGLNQAIIMAATSGHFELNVYKPLIIHNILSMIDLLADSMKSFTDNLLAGLEANEVRIKAYLDHSLMLVTALNPVIGYDNAAKIAKHAHENHSSLKEAALALGLLSEAEFDKAIDAHKMAHPHPKEDDE